MGGVASVLDVLSLFIFVKEDWICIMTRYHVELNINVLLTSNLPIDSGDSQWRHPLMIPFHFLWVKLTNRTRSQFVCDVTWFYFCFFSHARCGFWRMWREGVCLKLDVQGQGGEKILEVDGQEVGASLKLDNFHGRHVYRP